MDGKEKHNCLSRRSFIKGISLSGTMIFLNVPKLFAGLKVADIKIKKRTTD